MPLWASGGGGSQLTTTVLFPVSARPTVTCWGAALGTAGRGVLRPLRPPRWSPILCLGIPEATQPTFLRDPEEPTVAVQALGPTSVGSDLELVLVASAELGDDGAEQLPSVMLDPGGAGGEQAAVQHHEAHQCRHWSQHLEKMGWVTRHGGTRWDMGMESQPHAHVPFQCCGGAMPASHQPASAAGQPRWASW